MRHARRSSRGLWTEFHDPRLKDLVHDSPRSLFLARAEAREELRGIPIVWTANGFRLKGLASNAAEIPIVALNGTRRVKPGWEPQTAADAVALWRWRQHVARAA